VAHTIAEVLLPLEADEILDVAAVPQAPARWMIVGRDGTLLLFNAETKGSTRVGVFPLLHETRDEPWGTHELTPRLHVSVRGEFAAVVSDYGKLGRVYDIAQGRATLELHGGEYHPQTVPFSFALTEYRGRTIAIHRTDWNRLDASDAATGELLTSRGPTRYSEGEPRPEHYLDYFHGRLMLSPAGGRVADDGWVWHPVGIIETWETAAWLDENRWESEDGPSKLRLCCRDSYWDHAMCWLDEDRIAVGGIGEDDFDDMVAGVRVFAVNEPMHWRTENFGGYGAREVATFEGPAGEFFGDGSRLFSADESGLKVWDVDKQEQIDEIAGFVPTRQHPGSRELVQINGSTLRRWKY
jgi:hypothetical protein